MTTRAGYKARASFMNSCGAASGAGTHGCLNLCASIAIVLSAMSPAYGSEKPVTNTMCPVLTEEHADPNITTVYREKTVAFCCDRCLSKFRADPGKYLANLPQFTNPSGGSGDDADPGHEDEHAHNDPPQAAVEIKQDVPWLGRIHPVLVHFPFAAIPVALVGYLAWIVTGREAFARADVPPLLIGTVVGVGAWITGNIAHESMRFSEEMHEIVERHEFVSTTIMILALCLSALRLWRWNRIAGPWRWVYGGGLLVTSALLGVTGYLGGSLVFGPDHLKW